MKTFSERHGYAASEPDITIREDAPDVLRGAISTAATHAGMHFATLRQEICEALAIAPTASGSWGQENIMGQIEQMLEDCQWFEVYDVIEAVAHTLIHQPPSRYDDQIPADLFIRDINRVLRRNGIGWQLIGECIEMRGSEVFEIAVREGRDKLLKAGKQTAATELHEALCDLSRRPIPELTGAVQHAIAALECLSKDLADSNDTLGALVKNNPTLFPSPLGDAISKIYGFASNNGRHLSEGRPPSFEEAELVVGLSGVLCRYLGRKLPTQ